MRSCEINLVNFLIKIHRQQLITFLLIMIFLIITARAYYNDVNFQSLHLFDVVIFCAFCLLSFIFNAYLGYVFKVESKGNFLSTHPFSGFSVNIVPHVLIFLSSLLIYYSLKTIWDKAHVMIGVSEILFLYTLPYIVFYSVRKIEQIWMALLVAIVLAFSLLVFWAKYLSIWNIYQWNLTTSICYILTTSLFILFIDRKVQNAMITLMLMALFLGLQTLYLSFVKPKSFVQALAMVHHYPTNLGKKSFSSYMLSENNWKNYEVDIESSFQRRLFKFSRRYTNQFFTLEEKKDFLKIILSNFYFDNTQRRYRDYYFYAYQGDFPLEKEAIVSEEREFIGLRRWRESAIACYYTPFLPNENIIASIFEDTECGKNVFYSTEFKYLLRNEANDQFIMMVKKKLSRREDLRKEYAKIEITDTDFSKLFKFEFHERIFYSKFEEANREQKTKMIQSLDFSNEGKIKTLRNLNFICSQVSLECRNLPRWEDKADLFSIISDSFASKRYQYKYHYWLVKEIKRHYKLCLF